MKPGKTGIARIFDAASFSWKGLKACWIHEAAFRADLAIFLGLFLLSFLVAKSPEQWLLLVLPTVVLLIVELLNSAIENVVDRIGPEQNEFSGRAKDMGSAAVFICLLLIGLCWSVTIWHNFIR